MGLLGNLFKKKEEMIEAFDSNGNKIFIEKSEWLKVFLHNIKQAWNDSDKLYNYITMALEDGFHSEVLDACMRLHEIDNNHERGTTILGICYMKNGRYQDAKDLFDNYIDKNGESGVIYVNYAKIFAELKDEKKAEELLLKSLKLDPNIDNAVQWWGAIHHERNGEKGFLESMKQLSDIKGSWRPQLWLVQDYLKNKSIDMAKKYIKDILEISSNNSDALYMISGELGKNGYLNEVLEYIVPVYKPEIHGPMPALNILRTYLEIKDKKSGIDLLSRIMSFNWQPYNEHWNYYKSEFNKI